MKSLVVGDLHAKMMDILPLVRREAESHNVDELIFLGDYCDHESNPSDDKNIKNLQFFTEWTNNISRNIKIHTLIGNHDFAYLSKELHCSNHDDKNEKTIKDILLNKFDLKISYNSQKILFTHAGVTSEWLKICLNLGKYATAFEISHKCQDMFMEYINHIRTNNVNGHANKIANKLYSCSEHRGGPDPFSGPLWADIKEHQNDQNLSIIQVVGHSPVSVITIDNGVIYCDTFSINTNKSCIGNNSLLLIENNKFYAIKENVKSEIFDNKN